MCRQFVWFWLLAIVSFLSCFASGYEMNMTKYFKMPALFDLDDYDRCLQEFNNLSRYCFVRAEVIPQEDSTIWQTIVDVSQYHRHHFDHRQLNFGICVRWCENALAQLDANALSELDGGILTNNSKINTYLELFSAEHVNRDNYNRLTNRCINLRLKQHYNLTARSVVEYCDTSRKVIEEDDTWNLTFYIVLYVIISLMALSTLYDLYLRHKECDKALTARDHYKSPIRSVAKQIFVSFSISRNWYRLNQTPNGKIGRDLRFLDCLKFFAMFLVIFAHTNWVLYEGAISNPQDPERLLHTLGGTFLIAGNLITVTFFVIGGFLLTITWIQQTKTGKEMTLSNFLITFVKFNAFRYLRLTIPYAFAILISGVYFDSPAGPLWRHIYEREQLSCRKNWWTNLVYANNFVNTDERCLLQGWYLATDTQSFVFTIVLLSIANRWPKIRKIFFSAILGLGFIIPGVTTVAKGYFPMFVASPQTQKDSFIGDREFTEFYSTPYMNFGCYFAGVIGAYIYNEISKKQFKLGEYKIFQLIWFSLFPSAIMWLLISHPIYQTYFIEPPMILSAIYSALQRNLWGVGLTIFIIGMAVKVGWIFRKFCCLPIFRILGRLTYGAFVLHLILARIVIATLRQPIFFSNGTMFAFILYTLAASYVFSFMLAMMVELPVSSILKLAR